MRRRHLCSAAVERWLPRRSMPTARRARPPARRSPRLALVLAVVVAGVGGVATSSAAASVAGPVIGIAGKCLTNDGGRTANGNPVILRSCDGGAAQRWTLPGDGTVRVQGNHCLAVRRAGTASRTPVWTWNCDRGPAQVWAVRGDGTIVNPASGLCLADRQAATSDGNPIWVYACDRGPAQIWRVPSARSPVAPSGQSMPTGDLPGWRQVFADDFGVNVPLGSFPGAVSRRWTGYDGFADTHRTGSYAPGKVVTVSGGIMNLYLHTEGGKHLAAAPMPIIPGLRPYHGLTYGRYAVRFRADPIAGYKTSWLLWPDPDQAHPGGDWNNGEIDFPEGNLSGAMNAFMHHRGDPRSQEEYHPGVRYGAWHTAVIEWTPASVRFLLDGKVIGNDDQVGYLPNSPMHWVLQTETADTPPTDAAAGNVQIDWVAIWSRT